mmetsp:Transcript_7322/g.33007  ORF Transcript_7322/g.33007 Transcript_7322/m.33007 type:complete len:271 (+) Transcript_7322:280-1092(+)
MSDPSAVSPVRESKYLGCPASRCASPGRALCPSMRQCVESTPSSRSAATHTSTNAPTNASLNAPPAPRILCSRLVLGCVTARAQTPRRHTYAARPCNALLFLFILAASSSPAFAAARVVALRRSPSAAARADGCESTARDEDPPAASDWSNSTESATLPASNAIVHLFFFLSLSFSFSFLFLFCCFRCCSPSHGLCFDEASAASSERLSRATRMSSVVGSILSHPAHTRTRVSRIARLVHPCRAFGWLHRRSFGRTRGFLRSTSQSEAAK